jgi:hypothetical protein
MWLYGRLASAELSTKCPPSEASQVAAEGHLPAGKESTRREQQTKTRKARDFAAARAEAEAKTEALPPGLSVSVAARRAARRC